MGRKPLNKSDGNLGIPDVSTEEGDFHETNTKIRAASQAPTSTARDRPHLIVVAGGNVGEMYALKQPAVIIGRGRHATIRIEDEGISRRHAKLTIEGDKIRVEDLQSANGTRVNGEPVTSQRLLKDGDKLTVGSTVVLKFTLSDELDVIYQRKMLDAALRDSLTGAFNKRYLMDRLATELAFSQRHKTPLTLLMLDVDHFKRINDTFGHPAGDEVLVRLANVAHETVRKEDVFARYGGEEFVVLCRSVDVQSAGVLAERLRERVASMVVEHEGERIPVTVSVGVAGIPGVESGKAEQLLAAADEALYEAKQRGRNRVVLKSST